MKKSVKILSAVLAVVLVFSCGVGATLAYLKKTTGPVTNTFAAQDLISDPSKFVLKEHQVKRNEETGKYEYVPGNDDGKVEVTENNYDRVVPGAKLPKDPFVRVTNLEDAYLYIEVVDEMHNDMDYVIDETHWIKMPSKASAKGGVVYVYKASELAGNDFLLKAKKDSDPARVYPIFTEPQEVTVSTTFEPGAAGATGKITFYAYLAQATNFTAESAWNEMFQGK